MNPTRREFLYSLAAATAMAGKLRGANSSRVNAIPAIDTHTHFYDPTRAEGVPWPPADSAQLYAPHYPADFRAVSEPHRVVGTVVVEASPWVEDNAWILDLAKTNDNIVGLIGNLEPGRHEFARLLKRFLANPLFLGLRFRGEINDRLHDQAVEADIKRLADEDLTLDLLGGETILEPTAVLARKFPTLRIVVNHLPFGDWSGDDSALDPALTALVKHPNVFIKVSNVVRRVKGEIQTDPEFYRPVLDALSHQFGPDRLVFGSNWPVSNRVAPYAVVRQVVNEYFATRDRNDAEKFFWRNSLDAYRWIPRGEALSLPIG
ncbi:MAG: amidohydrolase family protein [Synoicihabitans sp.]